MGVVFYYKPELINYMLLGKKMQGRCGGGSDAMEVQTEKLSLLEKEEKEWKSRDVNLTSRAASLSALVAWGICANLKRKR